jgi:hypothetical protein
MENPDIHALRREVKYLMIDNGLDLKGSQLELSRRLNLPHKSLNMAITGFRDTQASFRILEKIRDHLLTLDRPDDAEAA